MKNKNLGIFNAVLILGVVAVLSFLSAKNTTLIFGILVFVFAFHKTNWGVFFYGGFLVLLACSVLIPFDVRVVDSDSNGVSLMSVAYTTNEAKQKISEGKRLGQDFILTRERARFFGPKVILAVRMHSLEDEDIRQLTDEILGKTSLD